MTDVPVLAMLTQLEQLVLIRARSVARYAKRAGALSFEGHFEITDPVTGRTVPLLVFVHPPGEVLARYFPTESGPAHQGRYPIDWLTELDVSGSDALLPRDDPDEAEQDGQNGGAPGTSRSPGAQHVPPPLSGGEDPCHYTS